MPNNDRPAWDKGRWYDSDSPSRHAWGWGRIIVVTVVIALVLSGLVWAIDVGLSGIKGKGDVIKQNNSANNQIYSQSYFEDLNSDILGYQSKLKQSAENLKTKPGDPFWTNVYNGQYGTCVDAVNAYNAASKKTTFKDWKTADLPESWDVDTACPPISNS